eukprot:11374638-Alexandrium_andersonii.AAC.1
MGRCKPRRLGSARMQTSRPWQTKAAAHARARVPHGKVLSSRHAQSESGAPAKPNRSQMATAPN